MKMLLTFLGLACLPYLSPAASVKGVVWNDLNNNGTWEKNEPTLPNVRVEIRNAQGTLLAGMFTDKSGNYLFDELPDGKYAISVQLPGAGFVPCKLASKKNDSQGRSKIDGSGKSQLFALSSNLQTEVNAGFSARRECPEPLRVVADSAWCLPDGKGVMARLTAYGGIAYNGLSYGWDSQEAEVSGQTYGQPVTIGPFPESEGKIQLTLRDALNPNCSFRLKIDAPRCPQRDSLETSHSPGSEDRQADDQKKNNAQTNCPEFLRLFPNPASGMATADLSGFGEQAVEVLVFDPLGHLVQRSAALPKSSYEISLPNGAEGVFWVQARSAECFVSQQLSVKQ